MVNKEPTASDLGPDRKDVRLSTRINSNLWHVAPKLLNNTSILNFFFGDIGGRPGYEVFLACDGLSSAWTNTMAGVPRYRWWRLGQLLYHL